jgi:hypothetical protein
MAVHIAGSNGLATAQLHYIDVGCTVVFVISDIYADDHTIGYQ